MTLPRRLAIVDVETTGAHPVHDRLTEIAIVRVDDGVVVERWESLVNPGVPIPSMIQELVGITDAMVAEAPAFEVLADRVEALLDGCVFVAHNARFDYGFIRNAFDRLGRAFEAPVLCTVKLSRALYPEHHRHGLDAIMTRHGLQCAARHRAMADADVLLQFARLIEATFPPEVVARAAERAMKPVASAPGLPEGMLEALPDTPGVYLFFATAEPAPAGQAETPLYVGHAASLRARVKEHFAAGERHGKDSELARRVQRVEWIETAGELGTLLLEAELLKALRPAYNRPLHGGEEVFALRLVAHRRRPPIYERVPIGGSDPAGWQGLYGTFRSRREADNLLRELATLYRLCPRRLGLEAGGSGACQAYWLKRCAGVCAGRETIAAHDARLAAALAAAGLKPWPWDGPVLVAERHGASGHEAFHVFDRWCHLASAARADEARARAAAAVRRFDVDACRILGRWLAAPAHRAAVSPLAG
jgi:DNA polymerase-3 subunit epsilon